MTRLVFVRHGESIVTVDRVLGGLKTCSGLSDLGVRQVEALRDRWARTGELGMVDALYSSTLPRARQTAEILSPVLGDLKVIEDPDLCEHHPGEADGMAYDEIAERYGNFDWDKEPYKVPIPGSESIAAFHHRVADSLQRIATEHEGQTVVIACHGGVIDIAMRALLRLPMVGGFDLWTLNSSITEFLRRGPKWLLVRYNDASHLEGLPAETPSRRAGPDPGPVQLREITAGNLGEVRAVRVWPHQQRFVSPVTDSLAEAHHTSHKAWYRAVYSGDTPVGFVMLAEPAEPDADFPQGGWFLWRLLIAGRHQRRGLGARTLDLVREHIAAQPESPQVLYTSWVPGDGGPGPFYVAYGFEPTGEMLRGEVLARLLVS
jgi:probable phosphoglycerate mutase